MERRRHNLRVLLLTLVACICLVDETRCQVYKSLQWTPDNLLFKPISSGCANGVLRMDVLPNSKLFVVCPNPVTILDTVPSPKPKHELFENVWIVYDNKSFENCDVNATIAKPPQKANRLLMKCDKPLELKYFTVAFYEFSAVSGGLEFQPGREYYFLATSDGSQASLHATSGGHCHDTANDVSMKMKVYVCINGSDPLCAQKELGRPYCEKRNTTSTAIAPKPSSAVPSSSVNPAVTSQAPCAAVTHTVWVNRTLCDRSSRLVKSTVTPSSSQQVDSGLTQVPCVCPTASNDGRQSFTSAVVPTSELSRNAIASSQASLASYSSSVAVAPSAKPQSCQNSRRGKDQVVSSDDKGF